MRANPCTSGSSSGLLDDGAPVLVRTYAYPQSECRRSRSGRWQGHDPTGAGELVRHPVAGHNSEVDLGSASADASELRRDSGSAPDANAPVDAGTSTISDGQSHLCVWLSGKRWKPAGRGGTPAACEHEPEDEWGRGQAEAPMSHISIIAHVPRSRPHRTRIEVREPSCPMARATRVSLGLYGQSGRAKSSGAT